jgi:AcrR family transcriptional regulator
MATRGARTRIQHAAVELMAKKGVAGTTTQDIARRAKCSQAAIYKYWDSKEALAHERFDEAHARLMDTMEARVAEAPNPSARVLGGLLGLLEFARAQPAEYAFLFQVFHSDHSLWLSSHAKPRDVVLRELRRAVEAGDVPGDNPELKTALLLGMAIRLAFFERQKLVPGRAGSGDEGFVLAAAAVLET